jgi:DNA polymerase-3 subunit delta
MKLDAARTDAFLKSPTAPVILIFGPDAGLVAERGLTLARAIPGAISDPFRFAELQNPDGATLLSEATAASLTGGRRVIRVRDAHDTLAKAVETLLKSPPDALVILEAGELTAKSKLRALAEKSAAAAAIACYAIDSARLPQIITTRLRAAGKTIDTDAAAWVANNIPGEEGPLRQSLELLDLYAGTETRLTLEDVRAALPDGGDSSMQDAIDATLLGDPSGTDRALALAYEDGATPVGILRMLLGELMRLRVAASAMAGGASAAEAMGAMRPPVFFKRQPLVTRALALWNVATLTQAIQAALAAETACKQTLTPEHAFCRQTMLALASRARTAARR